MLNQYFQALHFSLSNHMFVNGVRAVDNVNIINQLLDLINNTFLSPDHHQCWTGEALTYRTCIRELVSQSTPPLFLDLKQTLMTLRDERMTRDNLLWHRLKYYMITYDTVLNIFTTISSTHLLTSLTVITTRVWHVITYDTIPNTTW